MSIKLLLQLLSGACRNDSNLQLCTIPRRNAKTYPFTHCCSIGFLMFNGTINIINTNRVNSNNEQYYVTYTAASRASCV